MAENDNDDVETDDFALESDYPAPAAGGGPPDNWQRPSYYDSTTGDWYWQRVLDPCPVTPLGFRGGEYFFVTGAGEHRSFRSGPLHGRGGLADLFAGAMWWPLRHFRKWDATKGKDGGHSGGLQEKQCIATLIRLCTAAGYYDGSQSHRSVGTWRAADGAPIVHAGDRVFAAGTIHKPGTVIDDALYVIGSSRQAPWYVNDGRNGYQWEPATLALCRDVGAHLDEWHWLDAEARELFLGGLYCDMLGDAPLWKPHKFVRAPAGSGKSTLLRYIRALLGGAAHSIQRTYSKAYLEEHFAHTSCAILLDELESDTEAERIRKINDLVVQLSDEGAEGGRFQREIDLHGLITMVATLKDDWKATLKTRVVCLELGALGDRRDHPPATPETIAAMTEKAADMSPRLRARAIARWDLFKANLALARKRVLELGGAPRDADQVGHLVAGWACMTWDEPMSEDEVGRLDRFAPWIVSVADAVDGADDAGDFINTLFGLPAQSWRGGDQMTIGQLVARGRIEANKDIRRTLLGYGLRYQRLRGERWDQAWLAIANKHPGLDRLLAEYPQYKGGRRGQILAGLTRKGDGVEGNGDPVRLKAKPSEGALRFAGVQSRAYLLPPELLPSLRDEQEATGERDDPADGGEEFKP